VREDRSAGSNYPPGVTGNEYEIAGPDWETSTVLRYCERCQEEQTGTQYGCRRWEAWECDVCGWTETLPPPEEDI
jgi:hypothetical protein